MSDRGKDLFDLGRHASFKSRADGDVLVLPERAIRIGGSGSEILRLCVGGRARHAIVAEMHRRYPDTLELEAEVDRFLTEMLRLGGLARISVDAGNSE